MPDKFDDEPSSRPPEDGRRQHKYSTADMKPERPWKQWCMTILTCLVCIAIMIAITLLMQKLFDPPEDEDWDDDAVNATDDLGELSGTDNLLPKTMAYVEDVCSEERLGAEDRSACMKVCQPTADCCNPFATGNSTCFEEQSSGCFSYAKCHTLDGYIDAAHGDLDQVCSRANLEVDRQECIDACSSVSCCYTKEESCVGIEFQACMDYAACQNLNENSIDVAPIGLDKRCDQQKPTCERDCKSGLCCSNPHSDCYRDNFVACLSYMPCNGNSDTMVTVAPIYSRVDPAPLILDDICSIRGFAEHGETKCLEACAPVQCCWGNGAESCFGDDPLGCMEYERCTILKSPDYAHLTYPPTVQASRAPAPTPTPAPVPVAGAGVPVEEVETAPSEAPVGNATDETAALEAEGNSTNVAGRRMRYW